MSDDGYSDGYSDGWESGYSEGKDYFYDLVAEIKNLCDEADDRDPHDSDRSVIDTTKLRALIG